MPPNKGADLSEARSCRRVATQPPEPSPQRTVETMELASMDSVRAGEFVELLKAWHPDHYDGRTSPITSASRWLGEAVEGSVKERGLRISAVSLSSSPVALVFWTGCSRTSSRSGGRSMLLVRKIGSCRPARYIYIYGVHFECPLVPLAVHFVSGPKNCPLVRIIISRTCTSAQGLCVLISEPELWLTGGMTA